MELERLLLALAGLALVLVAAQAFRAWHTARVRGVRLENAGRPTVLYFATDSCVQCASVQTPTLDRLAAARPDIEVRRLDALRDRDLAAQFSVLTVPTTVVIGPDGGVRAVNRGLANLERLQQQVA